jgi:colanic acid/amylovoran biosynthesis protein
VGILRRAAAVWVRDADSFAFLQQALGRDFDPARHRLGVDVAVALPPGMPGVLDRDLMGWLAPERGFPLAGLNVSGLLCNDAAHARKAFGLADLHSEQTEALARGLLEATRPCGLLLVPHVHRPTATPKATSTPRAALGRRLGERWAKGACTSSPSASTRWS